MDDKVFNGLLQATKEALAHYKGEKLDLRATELPEPPADRRAGSGPPATGRQGR